MRGGTGPRWRDGGGGDPALPDQVLARPTAHIGGARWLWAAVLEQAVRDVRDGARLRPGTALRAVEAAAWLENDRAMGVGSARWVAAVCGVDLSAVRRALDPPPAPASPRRGIQP